MNKKMTIWGREFDLKVVFDVYSGEEVSSEQKEALEAFGTVAESLLSDSSELEKYCMKKNRKEIGESITNIFKYIIPRSLFVKRNSKKHIIALLCDYKYDEEHGLALVFENEKLTKIGPQDDI